MNDYDLEMPSNSILEDVFFKIFLGGACPQTPSVSMLRMLIVLCKIICILCFTQLLAFMTTQQPKFSIHIASSVAGWPDHCFLWACVLLD